MVMEKKVISAPKKTRMKIKNVRKKTRKMMMRIMRMLMEKKVISSRNRKIKKKLKVKKTLTPMKKKMLRRKRRS